MAEILTGRWGANKRARNQRAERDARQISARCSVPKPPWRPYAPMFLRLRFTPRGILWDELRGRLGLLSPEERQLA